MTNFGEGAETGGRGDSESVKSPIAKKDYFNLAC
jgi:hypothetical protein